jgi:hypothetical protein
MQDIMLKKIIVMTLAFLVIQGFLTIHGLNAQDLDFIDDLNDKEQQAVEKLLQNYSLENENIYRGYTKVKADESVENDLVVYKGTAVIKGAVTGDVIVLFGDAELNSTAYVSGDVVCLDGKIWVTRGATVFGDLFEMRSSDSRKENIEYSNDTTKAFKKWRKDYDEHVDRLFLTYDRVDGVTLGLKMPSAKWWKKKNYPFAVIGKGGYSFASKTFQYKIGFQRWITRTSLLSVGAEMHDMTTTEDEWIIREEENSLAAFFLKEDFRDYYNKKGYGIYLNTQPSSALSVSAGFHHDDIENQNKKTNWSLFGGDKQFRENPVAFDAERYDVSNGLTIKSLKLNLSLDTRPNKAHPILGWNIHLMAERATKQLNSPFEFSRIILDVRRYQPLSWHEHLVFRLRAGSSSGDLPAMYRFDLGGISTLRGYEFKEMTGDRMMLANIEYWLDLGFGDWSFGDDFYLVFFMDSGYSWFADSDSVSNGSDITLDQGFDRLSWAQLRNNAGVSIAGRDNSWRLNFAKRLDRADDDIVITFRINHPF